MRKFILILGFIFLIIVPLAACGTDNDNPKEEKDSAVQTDASDQSDEIDGDEEKEQGNKKETNLTLPDGFPTDFPFPDNITITEINDDSDEDRYSYSIRFDFDPDIDPDATFEIYDDYTEDLGYNVLLGGEEYFANGIFQYGAHDPMSANNMFVVTLKPEDGTFGSIDVKLEK